MSRPRAAKGSFPYPHRTLEQVFAASRAGIRRPVEDDPDAAIRLGLVARSALPDASCKNCGARGWCEHRRAAA